eukprot:7531623-Pyramimonas_sp.AAC.1
MFFPVPVAEEFRDCTQRFLVVYTALAVKADREGALLWSEPSKFHWLWHMSDRAMYMHPRHGATMIDETFMGKIKLIAQACAAGTAAHLVPAKVMFKHQWLMHYIMVHGSDW